MLKRPWRQYLVITDERVAVVEMEPALLSGWNMTKVWVQGAADWPLSRDRIVAWKMANDDGKTTIARNLPSEFRAQLLAKAGLA